MAKETTNPEDLLMERYEQLRAAKGLKPIERQPLPLEVGAVLDWPWKPFQNHSLEEQSEITNRRTKNKHRSEGFNLPEMPRSRMVLHLVEGHMAAVKELGGIAKVLLPFLQRIPKWDPTQPDWSAVETLLLTGYKVAPPALVDLTILDIRRFLITDPVKAKSAKRQVKKGKPRNPGLTPLQTQILSMKMAGQSVTQIAKHLGKHRQSVDTMLKKAQRKVAAGTSGVERSHSSVGAFSGTQRLDQRGRRTRADQEDEIEKDDEL